MLQKYGSAKTIHILITWYQHASGVTHPILEYIPWPISYVNSTWVKEFIRLLRKYSIQLKIQKKKIPKNQRHNDICIMYEILSINSSITMLKRMNACKILLQVIFLSNMTNNVGTRLPPLQ